MEQRCPMHMLWNVLCVTTTLHRVQHELPFVKRERGRGQTSPFSWLPLMSAADPFGILVKRASSTPPPGLSTGYAAEFQPAYKKCCLCWFGAYLCGLIETNLNVPPQSNPILLPGSMRQHLRHVKPILCHIRGV